MNNDQELINKIYDNIIYNDLNSIKELVDKGVDIHQNGDRAFLMSCYWGNVQIIDYFLSKGADINASSIPVYNGHDRYSIYGNALSLAVDNKKWEAFDYLLEKGAKVDLSDSLVLARILFQREFNKAKILIEKGANVDDSRALIDTVTQSQWTIAKFIVNETNVNIHVHDDFPLRHSCYLNNFEMVKLLVEKGANINAVSNKGNYTVFDGREDDEDSQFNDTALTYSIYNLNWDIFNYLIENGADPNINNQEPFLYLCPLVTQYPRTKEFAQYYIDKEYVIFNESIFDELVKTSESDLLIHLLCDYPKKDIDEAILIHKKSIYEYNNVDVFRCLLDKGYEISQETRDMLIKEKKDEFLKILLKHDLDDELNRNNNSSKKMKI